MASSAQAVRIPDGPGRYPSLSLMCESTDWALTGPGLAGSASWCGRLCATCLWQRELAKILDQVQTRRRGPSWARLGTGWRDHQPVTLRQIYVMISKLLGWMVLRAKIGHRQQTIER